jgi:hypothetical protein
MECNLRRASLELCIIVFCLRDLRDRRSLWGAAYLKSVHGTYVSFGPIVRWQFSCFWAVTLLWYKNWMRGGVLHSHCTVKRVICLLGTFSYIHTVENHPEIYRRRCGVLFLIKSGE